MIFLKIKLKIIFKKQYTAVCAKDSSGLYDFNLTIQLINLVKENNLDYAVDIYHVYGSDVSPALKAWNDIKGDLIGTGGHSSLGFERTNYKELENTIKLLLAYLL